jgi:hypothetical protein
LSKMMSNFDELQKVLGLDAPPSDRDGRMTGVPAEAQVLTGCHSAASWGFAAGVFTALSPVITLGGVAGGWVLVKGAGWVLGRVFG